MTNPTADMAKQLRKLMTTKEGLDNQLEDVKGEISQLKIALAQEMEKQELSNFKVEGIGTVYLAPVMFVKANKERMAELIQWFDNSGLGVLAPRTINPKTLQATYKERLENNQPLPSDQLVSVSSMVEARLRSK